jgi:hypothetical protein
LIETDFGKLNHKLKKKNCWGNENHEKTLKKPENKEGEEIKFKNQYKYL